ncbi:hypothetical protein ACGFIZ_34105, partial [Micromonospora sp. NPDC048830]
MSTDPGQPHIDNRRADEGSGNLGDWATYQGTDMDWQPSPAVTHTDAGTLHAGDTLHHPGDEPPTPAPLHPDQPQPQPTAGSQWVRDRDGARTLFNQHAGHIATTTQQQEQLRQLWNALIDRMDDDGIITASEPTLADAASIPPSTVHNRIVALRERGLLRLVREGHGGVAARYRVSDPGQPRQAPLPALPAGSQWVRDRDGARTLFDQHAGHIATTTQQQEELRQLWNALIDRMDDDGLITASEPTLADATSTPRSTVHNRIGALRERGLLRLVREGHGGVAARYRVTDPGPPRQALPALPAGSQWVRDRDGARTLFNQHAGHIATTTQHQEQPLRQLWNALIDRMDGDGLITASGSTLADATSTARPTVHNRIVALRDHGLLQLVREAHGGVAARYRVTDPGPPRQAPVPGPAPEGDRPQGSADLSWLNHGDTSPVPGPVPAPPAGTGLPGLPGPLDDPNAPTTSSWPPAGPAASSWPAGWTEPAGPGPGSGVTDGHYGAAMSTYPGQQRIDNQAGAGSGNLGDWATYQGTDMDWQPSPAVTRTDAGTLHAGDTLHHPADEPPTPAPLHPDQPQPQPTAGSWVRDPDRARTLFNQHAGHIATTTGQREELRQLWNALIRSMNDGYITVSEQALARAAGTSQPTAHRRIGALRDHGLLQLVREAHGDVAARYRVTDPGQPRQAPVPALPAGSQWVRDPDGAWTLFNQHVGHIATTTQQQDQLRQLWNALIRSMNDEGFITVSEPALARAAGTSQPTAHRRIRALRDHGLLQLDREAHGGEAARYRVTDPGPLRQAPVPGPALGPDRPQQGEDLSWRYHGDTSPMSGPVPAPPAG